MPSWGEIVARQSDGALNLDALREDAVLKLSTYRKRNVICYYSGWLQGAIDQDIMICDNDMNGLMNAIRGMDRSTGLDLVLHTPGGDVAATEAIVSYIKDCFGDDVCAIVPQLAMSAGTMIACHVRACSWANNHPLAQRILNLMVSLLVVSWKSSSWQLGKLKRILHRLSYGLR